MANSAKGPKLRMVSLKGLQQAIREAAGKPLPPEVEFMAGLQQIDYVIVDSEKP